MFRFEANPAVANQYRIINAADQSGELNGINYGQADAPVYYTMIQSNGDAGAKFQIVAPVANAYGFDQLHAQSNGAMLVMWNNSDYNGASMWKFEKLSDCIEEYYTASAAEMATLVDDEYSPIDFSFGVEHGNYAEEEFNAMVAAFQAMIAAKDGETNVLAQAIITLTEAVTAFRATRVNFAPIFSALVAEMAELVDDEYNPIGFEFGEEHGNYSEEEFNAMVAAYQVMLTDQQNGALTLSVTTVALTEAIAAFRETLVDYTPVYTELLAQMQQLVDTSYNPIGFELGTEHNNYGQEAFDEMIVAFQAMLNDRIGGSATLSVTTANLTTALAAFRATRVDFMPLFDELSAEMATLIDNSGNPIGFELGEEHGNYAKAEFDAMDEAYVAMVMDMMGGGNTLSVTTAALTEAIAAFRATLVDFTSEYEELVAEMATLVDGQMNPIDFTLGEAYGNYGQTEFNAMVAAYQAMVADYAAGGTTLSVSMAALTEAIAEFHGSRVIVDGIAATSTVDIKIIVVDGTLVATGIDAPVQVYSLTGERKQNRNLENGVYLGCVAGKTFKVMVKK